MTLDTEAHDTSRHLGYCIDVLTQTQRHTQIHRDRQTDRYRQTDTEAHDTARQLGYCIDVLTQTDRQTYTDIQGHTQGQTDTEAHDT